MVKIIFSDFDNTMLDYYSNENYFDDYKISVFSRLKEKNIKLCIVTGRSVSFFEQFPNLLEVVDYIMGSNGACIYDVKNKKFIHRTLIKEDEFDDVIRYLVDCKYPFLLNCGNVRYKCGEWDTKGCLDFIPGNRYDCEQIIFNVIDDELDVLFNYLESIDNIKVNNISNWMGYSNIDLNDRSVSKGNSVEWLCEYLNIDLDDAIAFGDGNNDRSMFVALNKGVAVGNAVDNLKVLSKEVVLDCKDNGIYKYIEDNILK